MLKVDHLSCGQVAPTGVSLYYNALAEVITKGLPIKDPSPAVIVNLMGAVASGQLQCWALTAKIEEKPVLVGAITTIVQTDPWTKESVLHVYSLYVSDEFNVDIEAWKTIHAAIEDWAKKQNCTALRAQSDNARVIQMAQTCGWHSRGYLIGKEF